MPSKLTVVIATFERVEMLTELIENLVSQIESVDIIVCDDGTSPFSLSDGYRHVKRYVWAPRDGGYHRVLRYNEGVLLAKTDYVVMLDDDCVPVSTGWSKNHLLELQSAEVVRGVFFEGGNFALAPWFSSINVSMRTDLARQMGPFDMGYDGNYGHEDLDLGKEVEHRKLNVRTGGDGTAVIHRGVQRHEYHIGLEKNIAYFKSKWEAGQ